MNKPFYILAINPGSTSTKIAVFNHDTLLFKDSISHKQETLKTYQTIVSQFQFRLNTIKDALAKHQFDLKSLNSIVSRGGMLKPIESGTYLINDAVIHDLKNAKYGEHASNLGALIAYELSNELKIDAYFVDPVVVDEMTDIAKMTGLKSIKRRSIFHALNQKMVAKRYAKEHNKPYESLNLIVCHLGGGISVGAHHLGRVIDVNNALNGDGPMSPERTGSLPVIDLIDYIYTHKPSKESLLKLIAGGGGFVNHLNTNEGLKVMEMINEGNTYAKEVLEAMCYQVAKEIGSMACVLSGKIDGIILTGGLSYNATIVSLIKSRIDFLAPITVYEGEDEMLALALGVLTCKDHKDQIKHYGG
jgi:butyrate kinase